MHIYILALEVASPGKPALCQLYRHTFVSPFSQSAMCVRDWQANNDVTDDDDDDDAKDGVGGGGGASDHVVRFFIINNVSRTTSRTSDDDPEDDDDDDDDDENGECLLTEDAQGDASSVELVVQQVSLLDQKSVRTGGVARNFRQGACQVSEK